MSNRNEELRDLLVKVADMRWNESLTSDDLDLIVKLLKGELKKARQTGPAKGQKYWFAHISCADFYTYDADSYDLDISRYRGIYPEERFAEAELRARKLIVGVNERRRELNEGKEFEECKCYIVFWNVSGLDFCEGSSPLYSRVNSYPFGLFKDISDCKRCIHEFEDELEWFYTDYMPLMAELDDYDWANAPGWGEED